MSASKTASTETVASERKTITNWSVFSRASLVPTRITCNGYLGQHPSDMSCHSNILLTAPSVLRHMDPQHSGGWFQFRLRATDAKGKATIWKELEDAGVEIQHLYCPHCRQNVAMTPRDIMFHLAPHPGANRVNIYPQTLCLTLGFNQPETEEQYDAEMYE